MLQSPTIFKQTVEGSKAGFDSLVSLVQIEANTFKQNRLLAAQQAQKAAEMGAKFQYDVAMEQTKAQIQASAPPSRAAIFQQEMQHSTKLNEMLAANPNAATRLQVRRFDSRWMEGPNGTGTMVTYIMGDDGVPKPVDVNQYQSAFKLYSEAEDALQTINTVSSAGLPNAGFDGFMGRSELQPLIAGLSSNDLPTLGLALMEYKAVSGRIPSVDLVKTQVKQPTDAEVRIAGEVTAARGNVAVLYNQAMPYLSLTNGALPGLTVQSLETESIANIMQQVNTRLNLLKKPDGKVDSDAAQEFLALNQLNEKLNELVDKYGMVRNNRGGDFYDLYLNPQWKNGSDPAEIFVTKNQRQMINANPLSASSGVNNTYQSTSNFFNALSQPQ
jgi:hypothetical protein